MRKLLMALLFLPIIGKAQNNRLSTRDSISYYQRQMAELHRIMYDSMVNNPTYRNAMDRVRQLQKRSQDYGSFVFFFDIADADYEKFNTSIVASGFPPIKSPLIRLGIGFSFKTKNTIVDFNSVANSLGGKSKKGNETIETGFMSATSLDIGIDIAKSAAFNVYPYAGLSLRSADISYEKPLTINPSFTNITNLITNDQSAVAYSIRIGAQAGIGIEYVLTASNYQKQMAEGGFIFFVKAGINRPIGGEKYKVEGYRYDPGIEYGKWIVTAGFKIFGKK